MKYSSSFGKKSSKIILGTAYFGDTISQNEAFDIMDKYYEMGGCHIDTARMYADGKSEKVIAAWVKSRNTDEIFISTKGAFPDKSAPCVSRLSEADIRFDLELSLKALAIDCIDFYWLHRDDPKIPSGEIIETMNKLVREGKIKRFGASNWHFNRIDEANIYAKAHNLQGFDGSQIRFSPAIIAPGGNADRTLVDIHSNSFEYYKEKKMPVAAYASQAKGFFSKMSALGDTGLSPKSKERYLCGENLKRLELIKKLAQKYECSIAAIVCSTLHSINCPDVFPIIGGSHPGQITDSMTGADITLEQAELDTIFGF